MWEYLVKTADAEDDETIQNLLNCAGSEKWELTGIVGNVVSEDRYEEEVDGNYSKVYVETYTFFFKRPKQ